MLNKSKSYTTGDRRSFVCRIRTGGVNGNSSQDNVNGNHSASGELAITRLNRISSTTSTSSENGTKLKLPGESLR